MSISVSAVLNTRNAERHLALALRSVAPWVDEILVVDMHSTDATVAIAERFGARVHAHEPIGYAEAARAFACAQARGRWLLVLDADELVPATLARRLLDVVRHDEADAVRLSRVNHLLGAPVLHSGWNPARDRHVRFFKRGTVELPAAIHTGPRPLATTRVLELPPAGDLALLHLNYLDVADFLERLNRYTTIEAAQAYERGERPGVMRTLVAAAREWLVRYLRHQGYRGGWRGFHLALLMALYHVATQAKLAQHTDVGSRADVMRRYEAAGEALLAAYERWP